MTDKEALKKIYDEVCKYNRTLSYLDKKYFIFINKVLGICMNQLKINYGKEKLENGQFELRI